MTCKIAQFAFGFSNYADETLLSIRVVVKGVNSDPKKNSAIEIIRSVDQINCLIKRFLICPNF